MGFKEDFSKAKSPQERQQIIYAAAIANGPPRNFQPITVPLKDGKSVTYEAASDYYSIGGVRAPMTAATAQALANTWGLVLPTAKMTEQIFIAARSQGGAIAPTPLSGSGYKDPETGKSYSAKDVVNTQIGAPGAAIVYNQKIDEEIKKNPNAKIYAGHGKTITQPNKQQSSSQPVEKLEFSGLERDSKKNDSILKIQPTAAAHDTTRHTEYCTFVRYIKNNVTVKDSDGTAKTMSIAEFLNHPELYSALSDTKGMATYNVDKSHSKPETTKNQIAAVKNPAHHKHMSVDTPTSTTTPITDKKTMVDIAFNKIQSNYKKAILINPLKKLEAAISKGLGKDISGSIIDNKNNLLTDFNDIERSVQLCVGFLINQGKIKEAQAIIDALEVSIREPAPSATTFVVPREMSEAEKYEPSLHQQIGRSQIDPPKFNHSKKCEHCDFIINNIYLLDSNICPNCHKKI